jgi:hypothetical protein
VGFGSSSMQKHVLCRRFPIAKYSSEFFSRFTTNGNNDWTPSNKFLFHAAKQRSKNAESIF